MLSTATRTAPALEEESIIETVAHVRHQPAPVRHSIWLTAFRFTILTTVLLGIAYPIFITGVAQLVFPHQANGSLLLRNGEVIGSELIGQSFTDDKYFHPRPSAAGAGYDATASGGTNLAQSNAKLATRIQADIDKLPAASRGTPVTIDVVTTSA
jgi:potassium-transporting ATPase KdpC subunit